MKNSVRIVLCVLIMAGAVMAEEQQSENNLANMGRGVVSILTSPFELLRNMAYDGAKYTVPGVATGPLKGSAYTVGRLVAGVGDVLSLGFMQGRHSVYNNLCMKDYIWQEAWWPETAEEQK